MADAYPVAPRMSASPVRMALREVRSHPGRILATVLALVLAVGFLAATQVFVDTEKQATASRAAIWTSHSDLVIESHVWGGSSSGYGASAGRDDRDLALQQASDFLRRMPQVAHFEEFGLVQSTVTNGSLLADVMVQSTVQNADLQWYHVTSGRAPRGLDEVALPASVARSLGVRMGQTVHLDVLSGRAVRVVGLTDEDGFNLPPAYVSHDAIREIDRAYVQPDSHAVTDPSRSADTSPFSSGNGIGIVLLVKLRADAQVDRTLLARNLERAFLNAVLFRVDARSAEQVREEAARGELGGIRGTSLGGTGWLDGLVDAAAVVALFVGAIIVGTTLAILVARRRRQIGMLRALGSSRRQVAAQMLAEALLVGVAGSVVGVPLGVGVAALGSRFVTHSLPFGLAVPWARLGLVAVLGVLASVFSAVGPVVAASRVSPMAALQDAGLHGMGAASGMRGRVRRAVPLVLFAAGAVLLVLGMRLGTGHERWLRFTLPGVGALAVTGGVLLATTAYLSSAFALLRRLGARRPTVALAALNGLRQRSRSASATCTLVLSFTLLVLVQVAGASGREGAERALDARHPADVVMQSVQPPPDGVEAQLPVDRAPGGFLAGFRPGALDAVRTTPGIAAAMMLETTDPTMLQNPSGLQQADALPLVQFDSAVGPLLRQAQVLHDGEVGMSDTELTVMHLAPGDPVKLLPIVGDDLTLRAARVNLADDLAEVTSATMARLHTHTKPGLLVARLEHGWSSATVLSRLRSRLLQANPGLTAQGSIAQRARIEALIDSAARLVTALLGIVALVAVLGVGNILALSVLERTQELGLLRALGMPRGSLRRMLLVESLTMSVVALVVGALLGGALGWVVGWLCVHVLAQGSAPLVVPWAAVALAGLGLLLAGTLVALVAGHVAARVTPIQALSRGE